MSKIVINNLKELAALAGKLADAFKNGQCQKVGLIGPLGAGKTTFVGAVARALGYGKNTSSPTFIIMHEYATPSGLLLHVDLYRLNPKDKETVSMVLEKIDAADFALVEWADRVPSIENKLERIYEISYNGSHSARTIQIRTSPRVADAGSRPGFRVKHGMTQKTNGTRIYNLP